MRVDDVRLPSSVRPGRTAFLSSGTLSPIASRCEALILAAVFTLVYGALAVVLHAKAPHLFDHLDAAFDADLGSWTIDLARAQGPHERTLVHPISVLLLNPLGLMLKAPLRAAGVDSAARLAASLLCALAGGAAVGAFLVLLGRLGVPLVRARLWALLFATSTSQVVFSTLPESYAFSALSLVLVFGVAASPASTPLARVAAGVFSFGITVTNIAAVALAAAGASRAGLAERLRQAARVSGAVALATAGLALVQRFLYPTAHLFFLPQPIGSGYRDSFLVPGSSGELFQRVAAVASHVTFSGLAAPRLRVLVFEDRSVVVDFARLAWREPTALGLVHWLLWATLLLRAARGLASGGGSAVVRTLLGWLAFVCVLHLAYGDSLFLYSGHWVFAVVALAAVGSELRTGRAVGFVPLALAVLVLLQVAVNGGLLHQLVQLFAVGG